MLALLCLGMLAVAVVWLRRRSIRRRWQQRIYAELDQIAATQAETPDAQRLSSAVSQLLRRASRLLDPAAPALRGEAWLAFLDTNMGTGEFSEGVGRVILDGPYQRTASCDADALLNLTRRWLRCTLERQKTHV